MHSASVRTMKLYLDVKRFWKRNYFMKYVFVDFEMNEIDRKYKSIRRECANEIVQIGAVMLDEAYNEIGEFSEYAHPVYNDCISGGCAKVTDITYENVADARPIEEVYAAFADWCAGLAGSHGYEVFAWSESDLIQLLHEMRAKGFGADHPETDWIVHNWIDYQQEYSDLLGCRNVLSLSTAVGSVGMKFSGHQHDALCDARNTSRIFQIAQDEEKFEEITAPIIEAFRPPEPMTFKLGDLLREALK